MGSADQLFNRFADAWNAGQRPDVDEYADQIPEAERAEFMSMVSLFLEHAPSPELTDEYRAALEADPAVQQAAGLAATERGLWPSLLPRLRARMKLTRDQLVERLAERLGVPAEEQRVKIYYHRMETGQLEPEGVSRRVLDALAALLDTDTASLERAGDFRGIVGPQTSEVYLRADMSAPPGEVAAAASEVGEPDEVDTLFTGGR